MSVSAGATKDLNGPIELWDGVACARGSFGRTSTSDALQDHRPMTSFFFASNSSVDRIPTSTKSLSFRTMSICSSSDNTTFAGPPRLALRERSLTRFPGRSHCVDHAAVSAAV